MATSDRYTIHHTIHHTVVDRVLLPGCGDFDGRSVHQSSVRTAVSHTACGAAHRPGSAVSTREHRGSTGAWVGGGLTPAIDSPTRTVSSDGTIDWGEDISAWQQKMFELKQILVAERAAARLALADPSGGEGGGPIGSPRPGGSSPGRRAAAVAAAAAARAHRRPSALTIAVGGGEGGGPGGGGGGGGARQEEDWGGDITAWQQKMLVAERDATTNRHSTTMETAAAIDAGASRPANPNHPSAPSDLVSPAGGLCCGPKPLMGGERRLTNRLPSAGLRGRPTAAKGLTPRLCCKTPCPTTHRQTLCHTPRGPVPGAHLPTLTCRRHALKPPVFS